MQCVSMYTCTRTKAVATTREIMLVYYAISVLSSFINLGSLNEEWEGRLI